jgi:hypothetical protein
VIVSKRNFSISKIVEEVYDAHAYAAAQKGLRYTFSVSRKLPNLVYGDADSIKQALSVITHMAVVDSINGSVEINVDLQKEKNSTIIVKFTVVESSKHTPYWFSVSLQTSNSAKTA